MGPGCTRRITADAMDTLLGAIDARKTAHQFTSRHVHMHVKELEAGCFTLRSFANLFDIVNLVVGNNST